MTKHYVAARMKKVAAGKSADMLSTSMKGTMDAGVHATVTI